MVVIEAHSCNICYFDGVNIKKATSTLKAKKIENNFESIWAKL